MKNESCFSIIVPILAFQLVLFTTVSVAQSSVILVGSVATPPALLYRNWAEEHSRHTPDLFLTLVGQNQCKAGDSAFVQGYLMEASCAQLQYSTTTVHVRHSRDCLRHTSKQMARFAVLEPDSGHRLWHVDPSSNSELVRYFDTLQEQANVSVSVWGSTRKDPLKGDTIKACAISVGK